MKNFWRPLLNAIKEQPSLMSQAALLRDVVVSGPNEDEAFDYGPHQKASNSGEFGCKQSNGYCWRYCKESWTPYAACVMYSPTHRGAMKCTDKDKTNGQFGFDENGRSSCYSQMKSSVTHKLVDIPCMSPCEVDLNRFDYDAPLLNLPRCVLPASVPPCPVAPSVIFHCGCHAAHTTGGRANLASKT